jgi:ABC-type sugar transport system ATPase subunit
MVGRDKIDWILVTVLEKTQMEYKPSGSGNITWHKKPVKLQSRKFHNKNNCLLVPQNKHDDGIPLSSVRHGMNLFTSYAMIEQKTGLFWSGTGGTARVRISLRHREKVIGIAKESVVMVSVTN